MCEEDENPTCLTTTILSAVEGESPTTDTITIITYNSIKQDEINDERNSSDDNGPCSSFSGPTCATSVPRLDGAPTEPKAAKWEREVVRHTTVKEDLTGTGMNGWKRTVPSSKKEKLWMVVEGLWQLVRVTCFG